MDALTTTSKKRKVFIKEKKKHLLRPPINDSFRLRFLMFALQAI